jgi:ribosomal protein S18 acetylase RimI-like enzyme
MSATPEVVRLRESDLPAAAEALNRAFHHDPLQIFAVPHAAQRAARSPALFSAALRYGLLFGEVFTTTGTPAGAAIWLGPDAWEITPERSAAAGFDRLPEEFGAEETERFFSVIGIAEAPHKRDVPAAHWHLMVLGVAPEAQGKGLARALMQPILSRADASGLPCYLETANPKNIPFYERMGFHQVAEIVEPQSGLHLWTFRRWPAAA